MLITSLLPLLSSYSLAFDLTAGSGDLVTLTIIPRKATGAKHDTEAAETRPISITATAADIDEELAKGADGALGQLIATRKGLADQIAEQRDAAEAARAAKAKTAVTAKTPTPAAKPEPVPASAPAEPKEGEPASLW